MNTKFEFLEHTADTKIRAYGKTLEEAFENVVLASTSVMTNIDALKDVHSKKLVVSSETEKSLLYDFLEEILFLLDTENFLVKRVENLKIKLNSKYVLSCNLIGDFAKNYDVHSVIKAITYSDMEIKKEIVKNNDLFVVQIVFDL